MALCLSIVGCILQFFSLLFLNYGKKSSDPGTGHMGHKYDQRTASLLNPNLHLLYCICVIKNATKQT